MVSFPFVCRFKPSLRLLEIVLPAEKLLSIEKNRLQSWLLNLENLNHYVRSCLVVGSVADSLIIVNWNKYAKAKVIYVKKLTTKILHLTPFYHIRGFHHKPTSVSHQLDFCSTLPVTTLVLHLRSLLLVYLWKSKITLFGTLHLTPPSNFTSPSRIQSLSFLPRCMKCRRGLAMRILSVCPSVTRVIPDKMEERSVPIFILYERSFSLVF